MLSSSLLFFVLSPAFSPLSIQFIYLLLSSELISRSSPCPNISLLIPPPYFFPLLSLLFYSYYLSAYSISSLPFFHSLIVYFSSPNLSCPHLPLCLYLTFYTLLSLLFSSRLLSSVFHSSFCHFSAPLFFLSSLISRLELWLLSQHSLSTSRLQSEEINEVLSNLHSWEPEWSWAWFLGCLFVSLVTPDDLLEPRLQPSLYICDNTASVNKHIHLVLNKKSNADLFSLTLEEWIIIVIMQMKLRAW